MKESRKQLESAILFFAEMYGMKESYEYLIKNSTLPEIVKMISYEMFLNSFSPIHCSEEQYLHYQVIMEYGKELNTVGWVEFETLWDIGKVEWLKKEQQNPNRHPYTCCGDNIPECKRTAFYEKRDAGEKVEFSDENEGVLIPTLNGWVCPCGKYTQKWN